MMIDISFDFRDDARGYDPDSHSPTLRRYHRMLWSKSLPGGAMFDLDENLEHHSALGDFWLSSDSVIHTYLSWPSMNPITEQFPEEENTAFWALAYTIGGMMVFPGNRIGNKQTLNGARGFHP